MDKVYNFSAGPAMIPVDVMEEAQQQLLNWRNTGVSVMEISHRSPEFIEIADQATQDLRDLLLIPNNYKILFLQGGARGQFSAVPLNLLATSLSAQKTQPLIPVDYINSGFWAHSAAVEAQKYCQVNELDIRCDLNGKSALMAPSQWSLSPDARYVHFCTNETIEGLAFNELPETDKILVADMSSTILSQPIDVSRFGIIYGGAQKNIGSAGLTLVIVREDLLPQKEGLVPSVLDYKIQAQRDSMFNTPPTFSWYISGLVFKWLKQQGGLTAIAENNAKKAKFLYDFIDHSGFYNNNVALENRSLMNVTFRLNKIELEQLFLNEATQAGLLFLKGHKAVGGCRASLYNAMPFDGVVALTKFMALFQKKYK